MITSDVIGRVYLLKIGVNFATGFFIDVDKKQYLVTAKHFGQDFTDHTKLLLFFDNVWHDFDAELIGHAEGSIDISIFKFSGIIANPDLMLQPDQAILYGQDVYFLGFPYCEYGQADTNFNGRPLPFARKAIVSNITEGPNNEHINYLDGHNVPGFSGGPVVYATPGTLDFKVTAVISGYKSIEQQIDGSILKIKINTGTIITYGIKHALDIINKNPKGMDLR